MHSNRPPIFPMATGEWATAKRTPWSEWMRELGLGFTNPVGTGGVLDMCLCFGCCGGEWAGGLYQGRERRGGIMSV